MRNAGRSSRIGTMGQLYHHLRELQATGWVRQRQRSRYLVVPDRVVCVLLMVGIVTGPQGPGRPAEARRNP
jgi:hypothetical protein